MAIQLGLSHGGFGKLNSFVSLVPLHTRHHSVRIGTLLNEGSFPNVCPEMVLFLVIIPNPLKMRYFIIFCLISAYLQGNAQRFCISAGYPGESSYSSDIKPWPEGGYIISGSTESGNGDVLLAKISESGQIIWQKTYGRRALKQVHA